MAVNTTLVRCKSGLKYHKTGESPGLFDLREPVWVDDKECAICSSCNKKFGFVKRRHHCRRCGLCFCGDCCMDKVPLSRMGFVDPVRQCNKCAIISRDENNFFEQQLNLLTIGARFDVGHPDSNKVSKECLCKFSCDHSSFEFIGGSVPNLSPISISTVQSLNITSSSSSADALPCLNDTLTGSCRPSGIEFNFRPPAVTVPSPSPINADGSTTEMDDSTIWSTTFYVRLKLCSNEAFRLPAMHWIIALQKAFKMISDSKRFNYSTLS